MEGGAIIQLPDFPGAANRALLIHQQDEGQGCEFTVPDAFRTLSGNGGQADICGLFLQVFFDLIQPFRLQGKLEARGAFSHAPEKGRQVVPLHNFRRGDAEAQGFAAAQGGGDFRQSAEKRFDEIEESRAFARELEGAAMKKGYAQ
jgi:hypothetical protein